MVDDGPGLLPSYSAADFFPRMYSYEHVNIFSMSFRFERAKANISKNRRTLRQVSTVGQADKRRCVLHASGV